MILVHNYIDNYTVPSSSKPAGAVVVVCKYVIYMVYLAGYMPSEPSNFVHIIIGLFTRRRITADKIISLGIHIYMIIVLYLVFS